MGPTIGNAFSFQSTRSHLYRVYGIVMKALWTDGPIDLQTDPLIEMQGSALIRHILLLNTDSPSIYAEICQGLTREPTMIQFCS